MDLSGLVVVATYHSRQHILDCLRSLERARGALAMDVFVVDNASGDGTADLVRREAPEARVVETGGNLGHAKAVNRGIRESSGEFGAGANPDLRRRARSAGGALAHLRAHPGCAIAGPRILNTDGSVEYSARSFPDPPDLPVQPLFAAHPAVAGQSADPPLPVVGLDHVSDRSVDWVSGACMCVRREAVAKAGGMDETYFMFNEDVDWCHTMKKAGFSVDFVAAAQVTHHIGASKGRVSDKVILERHRGMIHYFRKHHRVNPLVDALAATFILLRARLMLAANAWRR